MVEDVHQNATHPDALCSYQLDEKEEESRPETSFLEDVYFCHCDPFLEESRLETLFWEDVYFCHHDRYMTETSTWQKVDYELRVHCSRENSLRTFKWYFTFDVLH